MPTATPSPKPSPKASPKTLESPPMPDTRPLRSGDFLVGSGQDVLEVLSVSPSLVYARPYSSRWSKPVAIKPYQIPQYLHVWTATDPGRSCQACMDYRDRLLRDSPGCAGSRRAVRPGWACATWERMP